MAKLKPFPVNPEVMKNIRPMRVDDVSRVSELHAAAMGDSLWAKLGESFLREMYRGMLDYAGFVGFVYVDGQSIEGFIAGSESPNDMMKFIFTKRFHRLAPRALWGLKNPSVALKLMETARYFRESSPENETLPESLFCSFTPKLRGKKISGHINKVLFDTLLHRGHQAIKVTTEIDNEGANRQLKSWGFEEKNTFRFYGKNMVAYRLDLTACERVKAKDWTTSKPNN